MIDIIEETIEKRIRPLLAEHNGDITLVKESDGVVEVKLLGACDGCPVAIITMKEVVESTLLEIPGVKDVRLAGNVSKEMLDLASRLLNVSK